MVRRRTAALVLGTLLLGTLLLGAGAWYWRAESDAGPRPPAGPQPEPDEPILVAPPTNDVRILVPAHFGALSSDVHTRIQDAARTIDPEATPVVYGRMHADGSLGVIVVMSQEIGLLDEGRTLVQQTGELERWIRDNQAASDADLGGHGWQVEAHRLPEQHTVELVGQLEVDGEVAVWARGRIWATARGTIETRACMCARRGCATVREHCELVAPADPLAIDEPMRRPTMTLSLQTVAVQIPRAYEAVDRDAIRRVVDGEKQAYAALFALEAKAVASPVDEPSPASAFVQVGTWCVASETECDVASVMDVVEASARAHAARDQMAIAVRRSPPDASPGGLEIRIGDRSWERRVFHREDDRVRELACLCVGAACPYVERSCSLPSIPSATLDRAPQSGREDESGDGAKTTLP